MDTTPEAIQNIEEPTKATNPQLAMAGILGALAGGFSFGNANYQPHVVGRSSKAKAKLKAQKQARKASRRKK